MAHFSLVHRNRDELFWGRSTITVFYDSGGSERSDLNRSYYGRRDSTSAFSGCPVRRLFLLKCHHDQNFASLFFL